MAKAIVMYGNNLTLPITLAALASAAARQSTIVDNQVGDNKFTDVLIQLQVTLPAGSPVGNKRFVVYAFASVDNTVFTDNAGAVDAAITLQSPTNMVQIGVLQTPTGAQGYVSAPMNVAAAFNQWLPRKWGLVVLNDCGLVPTAGTVTWVGVNLIAGS